MPTIGRATIDVVYDGHDMPAQARRLGREAGEGFGEEFGKSYPDKIDEGFKRNADIYQRRGEEAGRKFGQAYSGNVTRDLDKLTDKVSHVFSDKDGLDNYRKGLFGVDHETGNVTRSTTILRAEIDQLTKAGRLSKEEARGLKDQLTLLGREQRKLETREVAERTRDLGRASRDLDDELRRMNPSLRANNDLYDRLNHILRDGGTADSFRDLTRDSRDLRTSMDDVDKVFLRLNPRAEENRKHFQRLGQLIGEGGTASDFRILARDAGRTADVYDGDLRHAMDRVDQSFLRLNPNIDKHRDAFRRLSALSGSRNSTAREFSDLARDADRLGRGLGDLVPDLDRAARSGASGAPKFSKLGGALRGLSTIDPADNMGQLFLLIIALAPQVAVLANAAAGGILILAGAIAALGAGGIGYGFVFSNLFGDLKKLDPAIRPAAKALQDFKGTFGDLRLELQKQVLTPAVVSQFQDFSTKLASSLNIGFSTIGPALNKVLLGVSRDLNSAGFKKDFTALFESFAPTIKSFGGVLRNTFGIVGELLTQAAPYVQRFVDELDTATGKFLTFLRSPEGKNAVKDFLDNATRTLKDVGDAVVVVAGAFAKLITPTNVARTTALLQGLGDTAGDLIALGGALGDLNSQFETLNGGSYGDEIAAEFRSIGEGFESFFTALNAINGKIAGFFLAVQAQINGFVSAAGSQFANVGRALQQVASGDFVGAGKTMASALKTGQDAVANFGRNVKAGLGDAGALFQGLDRTAQTQLTALSTRFNIPKAKSQEFGGEIARLASAAGVDIKSIAGSKSWAEIGSKLGLTGTSVKDLVKRFGELPPVKSTKVTADGADKSAAQVKTLDSQIKGLKDKIVKAEEEGAKPSSARVKDLQAQVKALQSKKIQVQEQGAKDSAARAVTFKAKVDALKSKSIAVKEEGAKGSADRAQTLKNKVDALKAKTIAVQEAGAAASSGRVGGLIGKIGALKGKSVNVAANVSGAAAVGALAGAIAGVQSKTVTLTQRTVVQKGAVRLGGIMQQGQLIAGGEPFGDGMMKFAKGGIVRRPTFFGNVLAGEAGPEAIVPLSGALGRVDRSVRDLSAIARGRPVPQSVGGGGGRHVVLAEGAIQVHAGSSDARQTASSVLDRLSIAVGV